MAIMSKKLTTAAKEKAYITLLGNPYAKLSFYGEVEETVSQAPTLEREHVRLKEMQNPYAFLEYYGEEQVGKRSNAKPTQTLISFTDNLNTQPEKVSKRPILSPDLTAVLDEVLQIYKPYMARSEWTKVTEYRMAFIAEAQQSLVVTSRVVDRLQKLKFSLLPGEKVEFNRAPAAKIIDQLKKLLLG